MYYDDDGNHYDADEPVVCIGIDIASVVCITITCGVHCHHLRSTLASALHVLLKNQLSQPLARLLPRQEGFHLFLVNISIPCEIFTIIKYQLLKDIHSHIKNGVF